MQIVAFLIDFASLRRLLAHLGFAPQQPEPLAHAPPDEAETYAAQTTSRPAHLPAPRLALPITWPRCTLPTKSNFQHGEPRVDRQLAREECCAVFTLRPACAGSRRIGGVRDGELLAVDPSARRSEVVVHLPGFARGFAAAGDYLFVGLSHLRYDHRVFGDLQIARAEGLYCGSLCLHLPSGRIAGELRYLRSCKEIYDVPVLASTLRPGILAPGDPLVARAVSAPGLATWVEERPGSADGDLAARASGPTHDTSP